MIGWVILAYRFVRYYRKTQRVRRLFEKARSDGLNPMFFGRPYTARFKVVIPTQSLFGKPIVWVK